MLLFLSIFTKLSNAVTLIREKYMLFLVYSVVRNLNFIVYVSCISISTHVIILLLLLYIYVTEQWFNIVSVLSITFSKL